MNIENLLQNELSGRLTVGESKPQGARMGDLEAILTVVRKVNTSLVLSEVLELVLDEAIRITKAERGFLMLADTQQHLEFAVGRNAGGKSILAENFQVSSSVLEDVFSTGESLCIENALNDERFERRQSILNLELQTIICSPLWTQEEKIGLIYVDSKYIQDVDKADIIYLFEILAGQAAIAIKNARLYQDLKSAYEDVTRANEQIIKFERMAMKGEIAGEISHELKNMVAVVVLQLQVLQNRIDKITPDQVKGIIDKTMAGAQKIQKFSQSLLTRSRADAKKIPLDINDIARNFIDFIKALPKFKHNQLSLIIAEGIPQVEMDVDQIHQVLLNLVNNAIEAFPEAEIILRTEYDPLKQIALISVSDNGPGIDVSIRDRILQEKITTKLDGHGYGLPICRQIVEHHGGSIRVESSEGKGAMFVMTFPAPAAQAAA
jgi:signal transduction histidine kinase